MNWIVGIVLIIVAGYVLSWMSERNPSIHIDERTETKRQLANGFRPDGSHDYDPEMEPGVRVCEVDRLERMLKETL